MVSLRAVSHTSGLTIHSLNCDSDDGFIVLHPPSCKCAPFAQQQKLPGWGHHGVSTEVGFFLGGVGNQVYLFVYFNFVLLEILGN